MNIIPYTLADAEAWDSFIENCPMSSFLHSRRFLSYHGERFDDCSLMIVESGNLIGVLPAAKLAEAAVSHPGATYGGIIHNGVLAGEKMLEAVDNIAAHYRQAGFSEFIYKPPPACYRRRPCDDDLYAMHKLGAIVSSCKLSCVINLLDREEVTHARRKGQKKAERAGLTPVCGAEYLPAVWDLVRENMKLRHGTEPVHSFAEIKQLAELFPNHIKFYAGVLDGEVVCGGVLFLSPSVWYAQYIHSNEIGRKIYALDFLYEHIIGLATAAGMRYFSFGTSNKLDKEGELNSGLYTFKMQFGGGGESHLAFSLSLI